MLFKDMLNGLRSRSHQKAKRHVNGPGEAIFFIEICVSRPYTLDRILKESDIWLRQPRMFKHKKR